MTDDLEDLLPDDLLPKGKAKPLKRSKKKTKTLVKKSEEDAAALREKENAQRLAQIVNLHIAGVSLAEIGAQIGMTGDEVDRMLQRDAQRYVRSQPALRTYVRNYISQKYGEMLEVDMPIATDASHEQVLEFQDRAIKLLDKMGKLHGAEAPVQSEVKVEAAPESIDRMVQALSQQAGRAYDMTIFDEDDDIVDAEIVDDVAVADLTGAVGTALEVSRNAVEESDGDDEL